MSADVPGPAGDGDDPVASPTASSPAGPDRTARHTNRLAGETSPYLLQHAHNPVDWYPWGPEALDVARRDGKPIFLSIGYAACHWCHVMERESFEDEATAAQLNRDFVAIKVDREERPDIDQLYMSAVVAMTGGGGWPMSVFLTPDGKPFYGGTYFPDQPRHGMPSFREVLAGVRRAWDEQRAEVEQAGTRLVAAIIEQQRMPGGAVLPDRSTLEGAVATLEASFDPAHGGWGHAPKFPQAMTIEYLLRRWLTGDASALAMARRTLDRMADGGIFDQLGGGFHRYATDAIWLVPHFEKMLYDNAQLARVYLHAWQATRDARYRDVAIATLDYLARELRTDDGAFASSQDADTDGVEGATFTWRSGEIAIALRDAGAGEDVALFEAAYGVSPDGNWEGLTILARVAETAALAARSGLEPGEVERRLAVCRRVLHDRRRERPQPARDDKALAGWNGLAIAAFAEAATALEAVARMDPGAAPPTVGGGQGSTTLDGDPDGSPAALLDRAAAYRTIALGAAEVISGHLLDDDGRLSRSWKDGRASALGVLEDHADLAEGLIALYEATFDERWYHLARRLADTILAHFVDPEGTFFDTADDHGSLVARPRDPQDNAVPSGGAMATTVLLRLAALTGDVEYRTAAEVALRHIAPYLGRFPGSFGQWLVAADLAAAPILEVAVVGDLDEPATGRLLSVIFGGYKPHLVVAAAPDTTVSRVPLLQGRFGLGGRPTVFVCRGFACRQPVNEPEALETLLLESAAGR